MAPPSLHLLLSGIWPRADSVDTIHTNETRTLANMIYSSLATIFACVWVSVHPNVPGRTDSSFEKWIMRAKLMVIALIAPEVIVLMAMRQRSVASQLCAGT
jgi:hypothetical protein